MALKFLPPAAAKGMGVPDDRFMASANSSDSDTSAFFNFDA